MTISLKQMLEKVYTSLHENNAGLDAAIAELKTTLAETKEKTVLMEKERLPQNNRQGRKMLQTYFKKRGVEVVFPKE